MNGMHRCIVAAREVFGDQERARNEVWTHFLQEVTRAQVRRSRAEHFHWKEGCTSPGKGHSHLSPKSFTATRLACLSLGAAW